MALTTSTMLPLGTKAPDFNLQDVVSGKTYSLADFADKKALLVMFICRHCPYVKHIENELSFLGRDYEGSQLGIVAICANDPEYDSEDEPDSLREQAERLKFRFPYLVDKTQMVAKSYRAACTPDFFLFNQARELVYRGQLDDSRPGNNKPVTGKDLRAAIDALLAGKPVGQDQKPSAGCNIKWKPGNEPT